MDSADLQTTKSERDIEAVFIQLVTKKNFDKITVKDICTGAFIGRSTFYRYYEDKYDLLKSLVDKYTQIFDELLQTRLDRIASDALLIELYRSLAEYKEAILALLTVTTENISLEANFKKILAKRISSYLTDLELDVPKEYIEKLYTANVMTAIVWSLQHGVDPKIANMMNAMFFYTEQHVTNKAK